MAVQPPETTRTQVRRRQWAWAELDTARPPEATPPDPADLPQPVIARDQ